MSDESAVWQYKKENNNLYGPYPASSIRKWYGAMAPLENQKFASHLQFRDISDSNAYWKTIKEVLLIIGEQPLVGSECEESRRPLAHAKSSNSNTQQVQLAYEEKLSLIFSKRQTQPSSNFKVFCILQAADQPAYSSGPYTMEEAEHLCHNGIITEQTGLCVVERAVPDATLVPSLRIVTCMAIPLRDHIKSLPNAPTWSLNEIRDMFDANVIQQAMTEALPKRRDQPPSRQFQPQALPQRQRSLEEAFASMACSQSGTAPNVPAPTMQQMAISRHPVRTSAGPYSHATRANVSHPGAASRLDQNVPPLSGNWPGTCDSNQSCAPDVLRQLQQVQQQVPGSVMPRYPQAGQGSKPKLSINFNANAPAFAPRSASANAPIELGNIGEAQTRHGHDAVSRVLLQMVQNMGPIASEHHEFLMKCRNAR